MGSIEDLLPNVALEDVFDLRIVEIMKRITDVISITAIILSIFVVYLILTVTPKYMYGLRPYLLFYILSGLSEKLLAALYKGFVILPHGVYFPVGWLAPMSHTTTQIFTATTYVVTFLLLTSLLMLLIDRYLAMTVTNPNTAPFYKKKSFYLCFFLTISGIASFINLYSNLFMDQYNYGDVTARYVLKKIAGSQKLLDYQPDLLSFNLSNTLPQTLITYSIIGGDAFFFIFFVIFIVLNIVEAKKAMHLVSVRSRRNHNMLIKMTYAQILGLLTFIFLPQFSFTYLYGFFSNSSYLFAVGLTVKDFFLLYDIGVTVICIKPYRTFVTNLFCKCTNKPDVLTRSSRIIEDLLPNVTLEDVFDLNAVEVMKRVTDILSIATIILSVFVIYLILTATPKYMYGLRPYLLFYIFSGLSEKILAALFKPFVIFPYGIYYPVGWLAPMSHTTVQIFSPTTYVVTFLLLTSLLMLLIDRYFAMTVTNPNTAPFYKKKFFYLFLCLTVSAISCSIDFYANLFMDQYNYGDVTARYLLRKVSGSQKLLDYQPDLLSFNLSVTFPQALMGYSVIGCGAFFLFLFSAFIILNIFVAKKAMHFVSVRSRKNHNMLIKMTYAQILGLLGFIFIPQISFFYLPAYIANSSYIFAVGLTIQDCFLLYDIGVTVICIKPYRNFVTNLFCKCTNKPDVLAGSSKISDMAVKLNTISRFESMTSLEDLLPNMALEDVFDLRAVEMMKRFTDILSIATIILSVFVIYLIFTATPKYMYGLRPYLLFYVLSGLSEKIVAALFKPFVIFPYGIYYPVGWLAPMSHTTVQILSSTTYVVTFLLLTSLLMLLIDRYFAMTVTNPNTAPFYKKKLFYLFLCLTISTIACVVNYYANLFMGQHNYGEVSARYLLKKISGSQKLLDYQPDLLSFNLSNTFPQSLIGYSVIGCGGFFFVLFAIFIILNIFVAKKAMHFVSVRSRRNHNMLIKMTYAQILGLLAFIFIPQISFFYLSAYFSNATYLFAVGLTVQDFFLLYDIGVTVICIRPYRVFVADLFCKWNKEPSSLTRSTRISDAVVKVNTISRIR
ncbi:hypothetical protein FO519_000039 [Halicephalobus sp. NKZ332]|nr:hypothetical protein FO519_000039 [Halicephalobus sp. NKZ332]